MRVTRSLIVSLTLAMAAAGCAQRPVAYVPVSNTPGIDSMAYGEAPAAMTVAQASIPPSQTAASSRSSLASPLMSYVSGPSTRDVVAAAADHGAAPAPADMAAPTPVSMTTAPKAASATPPVGAAAADAPSVSEGPYTLDSGDRLRVIVFGQDGLTNSYVVDAGGHIAMPLIGSVLARGATSDQLGTRIADKLRDGFIREPHVAVEIEAYRPFFILGEVTAPGQYPYVTNMTVETAVAIAGGFGPRGFRDRVTISRNIEGRPYRFAAPITYSVRPGDTIVVQERWF